MSVGTWTALPAPSNPFSPCQASSQFLAGALTAFPCLWRLPATEGGREGFAALCTRVVAACDVMVRAAVSVAARTVFADAQPLGDALPADLEALEGHSAASEALAEALAIAQLPQTPDTGPSSLFGDAEDAAGAAGGATAGAEAPPAPEAAALLALWAATNDELQAFLVVRTVRGKGSGSGEGGSKGTGRRLGAQLTCAGAGTRRPGQRLPVAA